MFCHHSAKSEDYNDQLDSRKDHILREKNLAITLIIGALALATPLTVNTNSQIVLAQKRNGNAKKTKLSDGQIIKNLGVKSVANPENDQLTQKYAEIVRGQKYTWENLYLKVNPYKNSPLTALMIFHTNQPTKISYQVQGISDHTTISNKVDGYQTEHQVPIVGLHAGFENTVTLTMTDEAGNTQTKTVKIKTSKLPKWIRTTPLNVTKNDKSKMQIGSNELRF